MEGHQWVDPLLITDVCTQQKLETQSHETVNSLGSSETSEMAGADFDDFSPTPTQDSPHQFQRLKGTYDETYDPIAESLFDGRVVLGFSLTSPDPIMCFGSPDVPAEGWVDSPELLKTKPTVASLENGVKGFGPDDSVDASLGKPEGQNDFQEPSFELPSPPMVNEESPKIMVPLMSTNVVSGDVTAFHAGVKISQDEGFCQDSYIRTDAAIGDGEGLNYNFKTIEPGLYTVDLHFAKINYVENASGKKLFDVLIQDQQVLSSLDIETCDGGNKPLVISDIQAKVEGDEGLSVKFRGVTREQVVCGIFVRKHPVDDEIPRPTDITWKTSHHSHECIIKDTGDEELPWLLHEHELLQKELRETKQTIEELIRENEMKTRECQEALRSFKELQNELMRKSMHVGSLAFAIEGQVKEKSRWYSSLKDIKRKLKVLKMDKKKLKGEALSYKKRFAADLESISFTIQSKFKEHLDSYEDLKTKFIKGAKEQKELYNKVLELKGNIRVFCRCRPLNAEEVAAGASLALDFDAAKDGDLTVKSNGQLKKNFKFDAVFSPEAGQDEVFMDTAPFATSVLDGYNVCIFAYGQTGTGKTFTMEGTEEARGVNYRTLEHLFNIIEERKSTHQYQVSVSVMEVYNEQIRDLLVSETQSGQGAKRLEIKQVGEGMHHVPGLIESHVNNMKEVWEVLRTGSNGRAVGTTSSNEHSSRSHCIHCVMVKGNNLWNGDCTRSKLWLIDLAGSERVAKTEVQGERLKETQNINRSLFALGDVISSLATKSSHIPFRNSKLTHLLQDSLGGDSKTLMFVQISPNENDLSETLCSLNFASRVRGIELGPAKKQVDNTELLKWKQMIEKTKQDTKNKDFQIKKLEDTVYAMDIRVKEREMKNKNLQDKIKELESQLMVERKLARQHVDTKIAEQQHMRQQLEEQNLTRPPLASKAIGAAMKMPGENSSKLNCLAIDGGGITKINEQQEEKENFSEMNELFPLPLPKRTGRGSICPVTQRIPTTQAQRRNSLIPLPSSSHLLSSKLPSPVLPPIQAENTGEEALWVSPKEPKTESKKLNSLLRKSIQKKKQGKSPMHQYGGGRVAVNVGMEKVRVSIGGSRGRMAQRVIGNARRVTKETQIKHSKKDKEKGWNTGTTVRPNS